MHFRNHKQLWLSLFQHAKKKIYAIHHFKKQNGNDFLDVTSNTQVTKGKQDKLEFIKIENLCASKNLKEEPTEWGKITICKSLFGKGLIPRVYKGVNSSYCLMGLSVWDDEKVLEMDSDDVNIL